MRPVAEGTVSLIPVDAAALDDFAMLEGVGLTARRELIASATQRGLAPGDVLLSAGSDEQEIPIELNLEQVSRSRERGLRGLGQPLKSLRDRKFDFPHYAPGARSAYFDSLGALELPKRPTHRGTDDA